MTIIKQFSVSVLSFVVIASLAFGSLATKTNAETDLSALLAMIAQLQAQIAALQGGSTGTTGGTTTGGTNCTTTYVARPNATVTTVFTQSLYLGAKGTEVTELQKALNQPAQYQTGYFGPITKQAIANYQVANGITPAIGYFGPLTRAKINETTQTCTGGSTGTTGGTAVTGDKLVVTVEATDSKMVGPSQRVIFSKLTLSAGDENVKVKDIKVEATGSSDDVVIDKVMILDASKIKIDDDSLDSDSEGKMDVDFTVKAGKSVVVYIAADMDDNVGFTHITSNDGLDVSIKVTDIVTDGADVEGTPAMGGTMTVKDNVTVEAFTTAISVKDSTVAVNDKDAELFEITVDNPSGGSDDFTLKSLKIEEYASTTPVDTKDDLDDVKIKYDGKTYEGVMDSDDEDIYTFDFGDGILIEDGDDIDLMLTADIEDGAGKKIRFKVTDTVVEDEEGNILASSAAMASSDVSIEPSTTNVNSTSDVDNDDIAAGTEKADMASFSVEVEGGKDIEADVAVVITPNTTAGDMDDVELTNIAIYTKDGDKVSDKEDLSFTVSGTSATVEFKNVEFKYEDDEVDYVIKADINRDAVDDTTYTFGAITLTDVETTDGDDVTLGAPFTDNLGHVQTVAGTVMTVKVKTPDTVTVARDEDNQIVAEIELDATDSGDDVKLTKIGLVYDTTSTAAAADVKRCELFDGDNSVSNREDAGSDMEFDLDDYMVSKDEVKTLTVQCDIDDSASDGETVKFTTTLADNFEAQGDVTKQDLDEAETGDSLVTVKDGIIKTAEKNSDSPDPILVKDGTSNVVLGILDLEADYDQITVDNINISVTNDGDIIDGKVEVYVDGNKKGSVTLDSNGIGKITNVNVDINDGEKEQFTFKADVQTGASSAVLTVTGVDIDNGSSVNDLTATTATGDADVTAASTAVDGSNGVATTFQTDFAVGDQITINGETKTITAISSQTALTVDTAFAATATTQTVTKYAKVAFENVTVADAVPVVTLVNSDTITMDTSSESDQKLMVFKIKADGGDIDVTDLGAEFTGSSVTLTNTDVKVYSDSALTNLVQEDLDVSDGSDGSNGFDGSVDITDVTISDGDTYYFVLEADIAATSGDNGTLVLEDANNEITFSPAIDSSLVMEDEFKTTINTAL